MAAASVQHFDRLQQELSIEQFRGSAAKNYNFKQSDVDQACDMALGKSKGTNEDADNKTAKKVKESNKYTKAGAVCSIPSATIIWASNPEDKVDILVVDSSDASKVFAKLGYNFTCFIESYTQAYMGSCRPPMRNTVDMGYFCSQGVVILMGPAEEEKFTADGDYARRNGCYIISGNPPTVKPFEVQLPEPHNKDGPGWPAAFAMDPRPDHPHEALMICCTGCASLEFGITDNLGFPMRYNIQTKKVLALFTEKVMFGKLLQLLRGGQQMACLEHKEFDDNWQEKPQKVWVFDTEKMVPLFTVLHTSLDDKITFLYSADWQHLAEVTAGYEVGEYKNRVNVFKYQRKEDKPSSGEECWSSNNKCIPFKVEICREY